MRTDKRLPRVLHVLLHLDDAETSVTSDRIGAMLNVNPSLVRRTMGGLRNAGFVASTKGHGGGWYLARPLTDITLADVYRALGEPTLFAVGTAADTSNCLLERSANAATETALRTAQTSFMASLRATTVADLFDGVRDRVAAHQNERDPG